MGWSHWMQQLQSIGLFALLVVFIALVLVTLATKLLGNTVVYCKSEKTLYGQTVLMTGGTHGLGLAAARELADRGCRLVLGCRHLADGHRAAGALQQHSGVGVVIMEVDVSCLQSVRRFAADFIKREKRLDILCLNEGTAAPPTREVTDEGLEVTVATNYLGHYLLTSLLFGLLKATPHSRVVVTSSQAYTFLNKINPKDLTFENEWYTAARAYALSQVFLVLFTRYFALRASRAGVLVNSFCPGFVQKSHHADTLTVFWGRFAPAAVRLLGRSPEEGAQTLLFLALGAVEEVGSGGFFIDCQGRKVSALVEDDGLVKKVVERTEDIIGLTDEERRYP